MTVSKSTQTDKGTYGFQVNVTGDYVDVHLCRTVDADIFVSMSIGDLSPAQKFIDDPCLYNAVTLFRITGTKGKTVFIESASPIISCSIITEDGSITDVEIDDYIRVLGEDNIELLTEDECPICLEN